MEHDLRPGIVAANQVLMDIARTLPGDTGCAGCIARHAPLSGEAFRRSAS